MYVEWVYDRVLDSNRFRRWRSNRTRVHIIAVNVFIFLVVLLFLAASFFVFVIFFVHAVFLFVLVLTEIKLRLVFVAHVAKNNTRSRPSRRKASSRLRSIRNSSAGTAYSGAKVSKRPASCELLVECCNLYSKCAATYLHYHPVGHGLSSQEKRDPDGSVISGQSHLRS
jgi:hypothetical protein